MGSFLNVLINQVLRQAPIVMAIIVCIGNIALKKSAKDTLVSTTKALVGMLILNVGSSTISGASSNLMTSLNSKFGVTGIIIDHWTMIAELAAKVPASEYSYVGIVMICTMLVNVLLARITPIKTIYLTGHIAYCDSCILLSLNYLFMGLTGIPLILVTMAMLLCYWWIGTWLFLPITKSLVGDDTTITLGHQMIFGDAIATKIAGLFKVSEKNPSCEELNLPGWLEIFNDATMSYSLVMGVMYFCIALACGPEVISAISGGQNYLLYGFLQGIQVAVGMTILLSGVRMFLAELLPSFRGFAENLVPGAIAAIDNPAFWSFAPKATLVGFIATTLGMFAGVGVQIAIGAPIIAFPSIIPMFFGGATMGVFCNVKGGVKGTVVACLIFGFIAPFMAALLAKTCDLTLGAGGHADLGILLTIIYFVVRTVRGI